MRMTRNSVRSFNPRRRLPVWAVLVVSRCSRCQELPHLPPRRARPRPVLPLPVEVVVVVVVVALVRRRNQWGLVIERIGDWMRVLRLRLRHRRLRTQHRMRCRLVILVDRRPIRMFVPHQSLCPPRHPPALRCTRPCHPPRSRYPMFHRSRSIIIRVNEAAVVVTVAEAAVGIGTRQRHRRRRVRKVAVVALAAIAMVVMVMVHLVLHQRRTMIMLRSFVDLSNSSSGRRS